MATGPLVEGEAPVASSFLRKIFKGPIMAAGGFVRDAFWGSDERAYIDFTPFAA